MKCKKCGNEEFEYTEAYKGKINILWKLLYGFLFFIFFVFGAADIKNPDSIFTTICAIMIIIGIAIKVYEKNRIRKSHTKAICKNCGKIKYID